VAGITATAEEYNILRWTHDPDILTYMIDAEGTNNPYVYRISDGKAVIIMQPESGAEGNVDIFCPGWNPPGVDSVGIVEPTRSKSDIGLASASGISTSRYDFRRRYLANAKPANGVHIVQKTAMGAKHKVLAATIG